MFPPPNLRDDFGYCVVHHVTQGPSYCSCLHGFLQQEPLPCQRVVVPQSQAHYQSSGRLPSSPNARFSAA